MDILLLWANLTYMATHTHSFGGTYVHVTYFIRESWLTLLNLLYAALVGYHIYLPGPTYTGIYEFPVTPAVRRPTADTRTQEPPKILFAIGAVCHWDGRDWFCRLEVNSFEIWNMQYFLRSAVSLESSRYSDCDGGISFEVLANALTAGNLRHFSSCGQGICVEGDQFAKCGKIYTTFSSKEQNSKSQCGGMCKRGFLSTANGTLKPIYLTFYYTTA